MNIVNIINFVRGCEPRKPGLDLVLPVKKELELCNKYGFKNTLLLQYDAMLRNDILSVIECAGKNTELGIWIEIVRPLCEKTGIKWCGREGWDWDWYVNPGFLPAYSKNEKKLLIDEIMHKFLELFGYYPKSVGSWLLDSYSMEYMQKNYNVSTFAICREQFGIDAYTLNGGYYNGAYYPSRLNCICPAQTEKMQINAPVLRLLGPDPIYNYGLNMYKDALNVPSTIEPAWDMGQDSERVRWFFDSYFSGENMALSYMQLGQENSFGWERIEKGLSMQFDILDEYLKAGKCTLMTMEETGEWFKKSFIKTPPEVLCASSNIIGSDIAESLWYSCINYRINFVSENNRLYIRDIYKFDENYVEACYDNPCKEWSITYDNLPVMDGYLWRCEDSGRAGIYFSGKYISMSHYRDNERLIIDAEFENGKAKIILTEDKIEINTINSIYFKKNNIAEIGFDDDRLTYRHNGTDYTIKIAGSLKKDGSIFPENGNITFFMQ